MLSLTLWDKQILQKEQLNANLVNAGQQLLRKAHTSQTGLRDTSYLCERLIWCSQPQGFVQIIFISKNHWACLSNKFCSDPEEVELYDSLQSPVLPDGDVATQASVILRSDCRSIKIKTVNVQQQIGGVDCGLFALAFACDLCNGRDPCTRIYYQSKLRSHYEKCLSCEVITSFPSRGRPMKSRLIDEVVVDVYCVCRQPERLPMACCDRCTEWFHCSCVSIPDEVFADDRIKWICQECHSELHHYCKNQSPPLIQISIHYSTIMCYLKMVLCDHCHV